MSEFKSHPAFAELEKLRDEFESAIQEQGKPAILKVLNDLFTEFPQVLAIRWTQYVPSFNDGDACLFGVRDIDVRLDNKDDEGDPDEEFHSEYSDEVENVAGLGKAMTRIDRQLQNNEDILEFVFSNNAQVTVTRDGEFEVDTSYDCGY